MRHRRSQNIYLFLSLILEFVFSFKEYFFVILGFDKFRAEKVLCYNIFEAIQKDALI